MLTGSKQASLINRASRILFICNLFTPSPQLPTLKPEEIVYSYTFQRTQRHRPIQGTQPYKNTANAS